VTFIFNFTGTVPFAGEALLVLIFSYIRFYFTPNKKPSQVVYLQGLPEIFLPRVDDYRTFLASGEAEKVCKELAIVSVF
jgi:hypothetical protein